MTTLLVLPFLGSCGDSTEAAGSGGDAAAHTLRFSAIPDDNKSGLAERYQKIADHLSAELGMPVEYVPAADYGASVEAFKNGDVQLAWFGGVTGVQARNAVEGARAIAQGAVDPQYKSYFVAHVDTGLEPSDEFPMGMRGMDFTFGSPSSTSGRLMPEFFIRQETGESPEEFFGRPNKYSGSHDQTAKQVEAGAVQCGALNYKTYDRLVADGDVDPAVCVKVWTTPTYPDYNWTAHPVLDEWRDGLVDEAQDVLVAIDDPELLQALDRTEGMISAENGDFQAIADTMAELGM